MTKWILAGLSLLLGTGLLSGCRTSSGITVESYPKRSITVNSKVVGNLLQVTEHNAVKRNDLLLAQITLQNISQKDLQFECRFEWKDKEGIVIETPMTTWMPFSFSAKERKAVNAIAPNAAAEDYTFIIRFTMPSTRW